MQRLAGSHLRNYRRLSQIKHAFHVWWNEVSDRINQECAVYHDFVRVVKTAFYPWARYAMEKAQLKRIENVTRENQNKFNRLMEETEQQAQELIALELARKQKMEEEAKRLEVEEKERKESKRKLASEREKDRLLLLDVQTEMRRRRVARELKAMKKKFKERWAIQTEIELAKAKDRITAYINNKDNKLAIDMKFETTKRQV
jgi:hypothetical protein